MKHIKAFESFLSEKMETVTFSVDDEKLDQLLHDTQKSSLNYVKVGADEYYTLPRKEFDRFLDAANSRGFDVDYEGSEDSVLHVMESENASKGNESIEDLSKRDEQPMVTGIANLLRQVRDVANRKEIADSQIEEFKRDGIVFDYKEFLKLCNL